MLVHLVVNTRVGVGIGVLLAIRRVLLLQQGGFGVQLHHQFAQIRSTILGSLINSI